MFSGLLSRALNLIRRTPVEYLKFAGVKSEGGLDIPQYAEPVSVSDAIAQPLNNAVYKELGLDFQKEYFTVWVKEDALALEGGGREYPDRLVFHGKTWIIEKVRRWHEYDGWNEIICVAQKDYGG